MVASLNSKVNMKDSMDNFYRTTRSIESQNMEAADQSLAIDYKNTINLQKAIDLHYDGDDA